jgi:hypothetical protein
MAAELVIVFVFDAWIADHSGCRVREIRSRAHLAIGVPNVALGADLGFFRDSHLSYTVLNKLIRAGEPWQVGIAA